MTTGRRKPVSGRQPGRPAEPTASHGSRAVLRAAGRTRSRTVKFLVAVLAFYCLVLVPYFVYTSSSSSSSSSSNEPDGSRRHSHRLGTAFRNRQQAVTMPGGPSPQQRPHGSDRAKSIFARLKLPDRSDTPLSQQQQQRPPEGSHDDELAAAQRDDRHRRLANCDFRRYPQRRYYGLASRTQPDFLVDTRYIYGQPPRLLRPNENAEKLCVDQSEWLLPLSDTSRDQLPFADGTNPSILSLRNPATRRQIDPAVLDLFPPDVHFLATVCMTDSQCAWKDTPEERADYPSSTLTEPTTVRTVLLLLDRNFRTLQEATVYTEMDAPFGRKFKHPVKSDNAFEMRTFALDDARLFTNRGRIWVSYREGKAFGYDKQVLNRLHIRFAQSRRNSATEASSAASPSLRVWTKASETVTFCCGRNMALIDDVHGNGLQSLTWVDPVTVITVEDGVGVERSDQHQHQHQQQQRRRLSMQTNVQEEGHRRLLAAGNSKKSDFHGTNGRMIYLPNTDEYMGIGHFHRPPGRNANEYARFGHHYTHAFFTIPAQPPHRLQRLSPEFVLPSHAYPDDAEIIQFMSGLELVDEKTLVIAYGINDCEGAAVYIDLNTVETQWLRSVDHGKEVVDLLERVAGV